MDIESCDFLFARLCAAITVCRYYTKVFEHLSPHLEVRNGRIKEMAFFEGEAKYSEQVRIGAINCAPPFTDQREDFNTCHVEMESTDTW